MAVAPVLLGLIEQYLHYSVEDGGNIVTPTLGIGRGCALSPLIGASLLYHVDEHYANQPEIYYVRYMGDFLLLARTQWALRRSVRELNAFFDPSGFEKHPDKTQIGGIERGFDWLGAWITPAGLTMAPRALEHRRLRKLRLYEQARGSGLSEEAALGRIQTYVER
ncbi:hypothetical protein WS62_17025 [Burkholderia sp. ABCPW 14]|nr:hypothetical protein WS62_17025 [Burkholderia sp. ABCPW 14]